MKNLLTSLLAVFLITNTFLPQQASAQAPEQMKYQAVIRDSNGHVVTNQAIGMQISIIQGNLPGTAVYTETQSLLSNAHGLTSTEIGTGTIVLGDFSTIDWANGPFFLQIETDPSGGTNYTVTGTNQLLSVPYAMHSKTADSLTDIDSFSWSTTGNAGTDPANNFVGTLDDQPLIFKVNNIQAGEISTGNNTFYGLETGVSNTIGVVNTANGYKALYSNTSGNHNTATGNIALYENTSGQRNTATGSGALNNNETGSDNTAVGFTVLYNNTEGSKNTGIGRNALYNNTTATSNIAIGAYSLYSNAEKSNLVAIGDSALFHNGTGKIGLSYGTRNTAIGSKSLYSNTWGFNNTAVGFQTLYSDTSGSYNTAIGAMAMHSNTNGYLNTAIGLSSMSSNTIGWANMAAGSGSLSSNTTGDHNTAVGSNSMSQNINGNDNTALGSGTLFDNLSGYSNTAIGNQSLRFNSTGYENTALGDHSLYNTTTAGRNVGVGYNAGHNNVTGFYNTAVGWQCGPATSNIKNSTSLGRGASTTATNQIRIGNNIVTSIGGYEPWSNLSDGRFKKEIRKDVMGLDFIMALQPLSYQIDLDELDRFTGVPSLPENASEEERQFDLESRAVKERIRKTGFIAQDVELAALSVGYDFSGVDKPKNENDFYGLRYAEFVVPLVKGMQEQQAIIQSLTQDNAKIKAENAELKSDIDQIKAMLNKIAQK